MFFYKLIQRFKGEDSSYLHLKLHSHYAFYHKSHIYIMFSVWSIDVKLCIQVLFD